MERTCLLGRGTGPVSSNWRYEKAHGHTNVQRRQQLIFGEILIWHLLALGDPGIELNFEALLGSSTLGNDLGWEREPIRVFSFLEPLHPHPRHCSSTHSCPRSSVFLASSINQIPALPSSYPYTSSPGSSNTPTPLTATSESWWILAPTHLSGPIFNCFAAED